MRLEEQCHNRCSSKIRKKVRTGQNICKSKVGVDARLKVEHLSICKSAKRRNMYKGSKMEKEKKQERKCNKQKRSELHCENLQTKEKKVKQVKQKNYDLQNKKRVSQTRTSKYKSIRNFQVKEQSGAQVKFCHFIFVKMKASCKINVAQP